MIYNPAYDQQPLSLLKEAEKIYGQKRIAKELNVTPRTVRRWSSGETPFKPAYTPAIRQMLMTFDPPEDTDAPFRFIDLFAGIGGMRKAIEFHGGRCVYTSEWNDFSRKTYQANFACDHPIDGDITAIQAADIPDHDLLVGGFPCQPFSIAGVSKKNSLGRNHGFLDETQGTLFFDVARIIAEKRPAAFLLENVKNLLSHDRGKTFQTILKVLRDELGYDVDFRVIDARSWVPQHRERIFIVGFRDYNGFKLGNLEVPHHSPTLESILHGFEENELPEAPYSEERRGKVRAHSKYTLTPKLWEYLQAYAEKHKKAGNGFGFGLSGPKDAARTLSARYYKDGSEILIKQRNNRPRRLTPRECARLMGFDSKDHRFTIPVSDTQAYKQFGNAVVVPVVSALIGHIKPNIMNVIQGETAPEWNLKLTPAAA